MATSIIINATDTSGKAVSKSYSDLKADATDAELRTLANGIVGFTNHTLDKIFRVDKKDITVDPRDPQFTVTPNSMSSLAPFNDGQSVQFTLSYLGEERTPTFTGKKVKDSTISAVTDKQFTIKGPGNFTGVYGDSTATLTITLPATDDYDEATATITFTGDTSQFEDI